MSKPSGTLSEFVQGVWSASVLQIDSIVKPLYPDAGSGIIFNCVGELAIGNETFSEGIIVLPVKKQATNITLSGGSRLAGIRFRPAIAYGVLGQHYDKPTLLTQEEAQENNFDNVFAQLSLQKKCEIEILYQWLSSELNFIGLIPSALETALSCINEGEAPGKLSKRTNLSQRQIERLFKLWLRMTPKHYQRVLRVKQTILYLRMNKDVSLIDAAQKFGFSDQAHMTREFQAIAHITPGKI